MDRKQQLLDMLVRQPNDAFLLFALGMEHAKLGECDAAMARFDAAIAADPGYVAAHTQKATLCEKLRRIDEARAAYLAGIAAAAERNDTHAAARMREALERLDRLG